MADAKPTGSSSGNSNETSTFRAEDGLAIIQKTAYDKADCHESVIHFPPGDIARFQSHITSQSENPPSVSVGDLSRFPLETLLEILSYLDITSLFSFRIVNRLARQIVPQIRRYGLVTSHAPEALLAIVRTELGRWYTIGHLFELMRSPDCQRCKDKSRANIPFAVYLSLHTLTRCCYRCVANPEIRPVTLESVTRRAITAPYEKVRSVVPVLKAIPGRYGTAQSYLGQGVRLVSMEAVDRNFRTRACRTGRGLTICSEEAASVFLPCFNEREGAVERVVGCIGCKACPVELGFTEWPPSRLFGKSGYYSSNVAYTEEGFLEHFRSCVFAETLWELSKGHAISIQMFVDRITERTGYAPDPIDIDSMLRCTSDTWTKSWW